MIILKIETYIIDIGRKSYIYLLKKQPFYALNKEI